MQIRPVSEIFSLLAIIALTVACSGSSDPVVSGRSADSGSNLDADNPRDSSGPTDARRATTPDMPSDGSTAICGNGTVEQGEECDDGNDDATDSCADCSRRYACASLDEIDCSAAERGTDEHFLVSADSCGFALRAPVADEVAQRRELIDALAQRSGGVASISEVLGDLNRSGRSGIGATNADRLKNHDFRGFRWNTGDADVDYWYPQGMTGSSDAYEVGTVDGRELVMVSWYHKSEARPTKGVRISIADITDLADVSYRHLLLVEPTGTVADPTFRSAQTSSEGPLHAGGIVWWGDYLYVADTTGGFRVYDLAKIMRATDYDTDRIGVAGDRFDGLGYAYVVPELMRFRRDDDGCAIRFSFVGLDRSSDPPALISGEYRNRDDDGVIDVEGRLAVWDIDPTFGFLDVRGGEVRASDAFVSGQSRMQGALRYQGDIYISSSSQYQQFGRLYRTREGFGESSITAWVYGAEDLYMQRSADVVWTAAEFPGDRDVVGIPLVRP